MPLKIEDYESTLDDISNTIKSIRARGREVKRSTAESLAQIQDAPQKHAEVLAAIRALNPATADAYERVIIAKEARLTAELAEVTTQLQAARRALSGLEL